ncbi:hypothetical protein DdX_18149 [Ditylenchus destructor]|uniref:Uncharacterized protein n=1 Tax=Ditylenchus destructor TaxID=166010 RepID=A0AAD4MQ23_9BILA|nr:hypothetical protein DdX_18149 [Ditylenchus destructor]
MLGFLIKATFLMFDFTIKVSFLIVDPNHCHKIATTVFYARAELEDDYWPSFQHFIRLLVDPFIYIRYLVLNQKALSFLSGAMNPDRGRLQCEHLSIHFNQKFIVWIKDHVRCDEFQIYVKCDSNFDEELLDLLVWPEILVAVWAALVPLEYS